MFGRSGVLNAFSTYGYFQLTMGLLGCNPIISQERPVVHHEAALNGQIKGQEDISALC